MTPLDPITLSPRQLEDLGPHDIHQFTLRAVNTLTRYRLLLGRCLLAKHRSQSYLQFGCSSAIHYATSTLGLRGDTARQLRRLAFCLESLPLLTQHAQDGSLSWAKLCEAARHRAQQDQLSQQRQTDTLAELAERSARNIAPWNALRAAKVTPHQNLQIVQKDKPHWTNPRARHLTPKQRIHILRRDGYRCQCPCTCTT